MLYCLRHKLFLKLKPWCLQIIWLIFCIGYLWIEGKLLERCLYIKLICNHYSGIPVWQWHCLLCLICASIQIHHLPFSGQHGLQRPNICDRNSLPVDLLFYKNFRNKRTILRVLQITSSDFILHFHFYDGLDCCWQVCFYITDFCLISVWFLFDFTVFAHLLTLTNRFIVCVFVI